MELYERRARELRDLVLALLEEKIQGQAGTSKQAQAK